MMRRRASMRVRGLDRWRLVQVALAVAGALLLLGLVRGYGAEAIVERLSRVRPGWLAIYAAIEVAIFAGFALRWQALLRGLGEAQPFRRLLAARLAGLTVGTLTPAAKLGGEPLRAYMIAKDGVPAGPAIATVAVDRGLELVANVVFAVGYCALFAMRDRVAAGRVLIVVAASGVALAVGVVMVTRRLHRGMSLVPARLAPALDRIGGGRAAIAEAEKAMRILVFERRRLLGWMLAASLALNGIIFLEYASLFAAFDAEPSAPELAGTLLGVGLAHALPVPAAIGTLEGAQAAMIHVAGGGAGLALVAAAVARLRDLVWTVPGLVILVAWSGKRSPFGRAAGCASSGRDCRGERPG